VLGGRAVVLCNPAGVAAAGVATAQWSASRRCEALLGIEDVLDRRSVALVAPRVSAIGAGPAPAGRSPRCTHHLSIRPASRARLAFSRFLPVVIMTWLVLRRSAEPKGDHLVAKPGVVF
jgi:hypothetical protein